jgi:subtilase family serine protease
MAWGPDRAPIPGGLGGPAAYRCRIEGEWRDDAGGTSTAAPIWAAIVARLNEQRRQKGLGRVGFAQPLLYAFASRNGALRPIEEGSTDMVVPTRDASGGLVPCFVPGFIAAAGWNPAVGLGVPDLAELQHL